jgi:hypothetical protein
MEFASTIEKREIKFIGSWALNLEAALPRIGDVAESGLSRVSWVAF